MAADAGELKARATLDNAEFLSALKEMANKTGEQSQAVAKQIESMADAFGKVGNALAMFGALGVLGKFFDEAIATANATDKLAAGFNAVNGPSKETAAIFQEISGLEMKSQFDFEDTLGPAAKNMMMLGVSAEQTAATMTAVVDAAAGMKEGPEWIKAVTDSIAAMSSHLIATQRDMKGLQAEGIDAWGALAREIGTSVPDAMEQVKKGMINSQTVTAAVTKEMAANFQGAGERSLDSWKGAMHILDETTEDAMVGIGHTVKSILNDMKPTIEAAAAAVKAFADFWAGLPGPIQEALVIVPAVLAAVVGVAAAFSALEVAFAALSFNPVVLGIAAVVAALALIGKWAYDNWPAIKAVFQEGVSYLSEIFSPLITIWKAEWDAISSALGTVWGWVTDTIGGLKGTVTEFLGWLGGLFAKLPGSGEIQKLGQIWQDEEAKMTSAKAAIDAKKESDAAAAAQSAQTKRAAEQQNAAEVAAANAAKEAAAVRAKAAAEAEKAAKERESYNKKLEDSAEKLKDSEDKLADTVAKSYKRLRDESHQTVEVVISDFERWGEASPATVFGKAQAALKELGITSTAVYTKAIKDAQDHATVVKAAFDKGSASAADYDAALAAVDQKQRDLKNYVEKDLTDAFRTLGVTSSASLEQTATDALDAYNKIKGSGDATTADLTEAWGKVKAAQQAVVDHTNKDMTDAFHSFGLKTAAEMATMATETDASYNKIVTEAGVDSVAAQTAWVTKTQEAYANILAQGGTLTEGQKSELDRAKQHLDDHLTQVKSAWQTTYDGVKSAVGGAVDSMIEKLVTGKGSFKEILDGMWQDIATAALHAFLDPVKKAISEFIANEVADLIGGKGLGGIVDGFKSIGQAASGIFGKGGSAASGAAGAAGAIPGAGGAASSAGSAATGLAGIAPIFGMVTGAISAITGVIGVFQSMHQETSLNAIEHNTRYSMMYLGERGDGGILGVLFKIDEELAWGAATKAMESLHDMFMDWRTPALESMQNIQVILESWGPYIADTKDAVFDIRQIASDLGRTVATGFERMTITINAGNLTTADAARQLGDQIAKNLSTQMVAVR
jgi:hypothetical protein